MTEHKTRIERDTLGEIAVPAERLYGAQTERSRRNFRISGERMPTGIIRALALVKKAAALVNRDLGRLPEETADAIAAAAGEVLAGEHPDEFPLIRVADRERNPVEHEHERGAREPRQRDPRWGTRRGAPRPPERRRQPRAILERRLPDRVSCCRGAGPRGNGSSPRSAPSERPSRSGRKPSPESSRSGAPISQDATPLTLGQEFSGYAAQLDHGAARIEAALPHLRELALGGTAVGTGAEHPPGDGRTGGEVADPAHRSRVRHRPEQVRGARLAGRAGGGPRSASRGGGLAPQDRQRHPLAGFRGRARGSEKSASRRTNPAAPSCRAR